MNLPGQATSRHARLPQTHIRITKISLAELAVMDRLERAGNGVDKLKKLANPSCLFNRVFLSARPPTTQNCFLSISEIVRPVPSNMKVFCAPLPFKDVNRGAACRFCTLKSRGCVPRACSGQCSAIGHTNVLAIRHTYIVATSERV